MNKLRRHIDKFLRGVCFCEIVVLVKGNGNSVAGEFDKIIRQVVGSVQAVERCPRMQHSALLRIVLIKKIVEVGIETAFIAIVPKKNAGMIDVACDHFTNELGAS